MFSRRIYALRNGRKCVVRGSNGVEVLWNFLRRRFPEHCSPAFGSRHLRMLVAAWNIRVVIQYTPAMPELPVLPIHLPMVLQTQARFRNLRACGRPAPLLCPLPDIPQAEGRDPGALRSLAGFIPKDGEDDGPALADEEREYLDEALMPAVEENAQRFAALNDALGLDDARPEHPVVEAQVTA